MSLVVDNIFLDNNQSLMKEFEIFLRATNPLLSAQEVLSKLEEFSELVR